MTFPFLENAIYFLRNDCLTVIPMLDMGISVSGDTPIKPEYDNKIIKQ